MNGLIENYFRMDYMPHGHCYLWNKPILLTNVISDILIAIAYFSIPIALYYFVKKRKDLEFKGIFILFSMFIALCGITHLIGIIVIWQGAYGVLGVAKALTAIVSVITAIQVVRIAPQAIRLPSPTDLKQAMGIANEERVQRIQLENQIEQTRILRESTEAVYVGVLVTDKFGKIVIANEAVCNIFGYEKSELEGRSVNMLVNKHIESHHNDLIQRFIKSPDKQRHMATGRIVTGVSKQGEEIPVEVVLNRSIQQDETLVIASVLDLSERLSHQAKLLESNERFERIISNAGEALWELNIANRKLWISAKLFELLGHQEELEEFNKDQLIKLVEPSVRSRIENFIMGEGAESQEIYIEFQAKCAGGNYKWLAAQAGYTTDLDGNPLFRSGTIYLIHQRKVLEEQLYQQHEYFKSVFEGAGNAIFSIQHPEHDVFVMENINRVAQDTMGLPWNEAIGKPVDDLVPNLLSQEVVDQIKGNYSTVVKTKQPYEYIEMIPGEDKEYWWKTKLYPQLDEEGKIIRIIGSASNITELIETQRSLEAKEKFITRVFNASLTGVYIYNKNSGVNEYINETYTKITGYDLNKLNAMNGEEFMECFHEDDRERISKHMERMFESNHTWSSEQIEYRFKTAQGKWIWCLSQDSVFDRDEHGDVISFIGSFLDITNIKEMQLSLIKTKEAAEQASIAKSEFLANMSHEIRTPMNAILGLIQMLLQMKLEEKQKLFIEKIHTSSQYLLNVLNDILDYSKIEAGKIDIVEEPFSVYKLISDTVGLFTLSAEEKNISIKYDVDGLSRQHYVGDPLRIGQIINNLVGNAVKFTDQGEIEIIVRSMDELQGSQLTIIVKDTGIGISEDHIGRLFQSFNQVDTSISRKYGGTGLGLSIIKGLLKQMGGNISVRSKESKGSEFEVNIPVKIPEPHELISSVSTDGKDQLEFSKDLLKDVSILLVEDNATNQLLAKEFLDSYSAEVTVVNNGLEAVEQCRLQQFDIVLMDLQMPVMDGFEAAAEIRKRSQRPDVPIIAMSAAVSKGDIERIYSATMNDHIPKPIDLQVAAEVISRWTNRKRADQIQPVLTSDSVPSKPAEYESLNIQSALAKLNFQKNIYRILIESYLQNQKDMDKRIMLEFETGNWDELERFAHTIKGLAGSLGAHRLSEYAEKIEFDAMDRSVTQASLNEFSDLYSKTNVDLYKYLNLSNPTEPATSGFTSLINEKETLMIIKEQMESGKFFSEKEIAEYEKSLKNAVDEQSLSRLISAIRGLDYKVAKQWVSKLLDG